MNCPNCGEPMEPVFCNGSKNQVKNGLTIFIQGYYGGFIDDVMLEYPDHATICHDCVVKLALLMPAIRDLLKPFEKRGHPDECACCDWSW